MGNILLDYNKYKIINGISIPSTKEILTHWSTITDIPIDKLVYTSYRAVNSDVGKEISSSGDRNGEMERNKKDRDKGEKAMPMAAVVESRRGGSLPALALPRKAEDMQRGLRMWL